MVVFLATAWVVIIGCLNNERRNFSYFVMSKFETSSALKKYVNCFRNNYFTSVLTYFHISIQKISIRKTEYAIKLTFCKIRNCLSLTFDRDLIETAPCIFDDPEKYIVHMMCFRLIYN